MKVKINKDLLIHLPNEVKEMKLPTKAQEIYCHFIPMSDKDGMCYSTIGGLAKELNCSKTTVMSNLKLLENRNLILERVNGKIGVASRFKIKLFNSTNDSTNCNTSNENDSTNYDTNCNTSNENDSTNYDTNCNTSNENDSTNYDTNCNNSTNSNTEHNTNDDTNINDTELKKFIDEVITLKINELKSDIINELRSLFNVNDTNEIFNDSTIKENKRK